MISHRPFFLTRSQDCTASAYPSWESSLPQLPACQLPQAGGTEN
nr:MAG TPA: hypothetical protein [Caudoviricetes sp.]